MAKAATLSVCIITLNEEANIARTLASVRGLADEIIVVDSGSTDRTLQIAREHAAKVFCEGWKGFAAQKNSALEKASCAWVLSLDADEEVSAELAASIRALLGSGAEPRFSGYTMNRRNLYFGKWIKHGGYYPDPKLRLVRRGTAEFELRPVHEDMKMAGPVGHLRGDLIHRAYADLESYIEHLNRYSSLGAEMAAQRKTRFSVFNVVVRPIATFIYGYILRGGFLDGKAGLLVTMNHAAYVSWKYAKAAQIRSTVKSRDK